ncbi:MAG: VacB/RNase II family 3'-5' exoribonuclease [Candidatus Gracilibacteria bacterium]|nr:VacB/RNase II family 3'-5' exoribonuclease [Candidatus Gracilibacteria bacterium]
MAKFNRPKSPETREFTGTIQMTANLGLVGNKIVMLEHFNGAQDGDTVKIEKIGDNPNTRIYKVIEIIFSPKSAVENLVESTSGKAEKALIGVYRKHDEKGGFITVAGQDTDVYVAKNNLSGAKDGDKVSLVITQIGKKSEAIVKEILEVSKVYHYGIFKNGKILLDGDEKKEIKISNLNSFELVEGEVVSLELGEGKVGTIKSKLHPKWQNSLDELAIVLKAGVEIEFSPEVLAEVDAMSEVIEDDEIAKRIDLRNLYTITIDGPDTKDIDDAISVEKLENGEMKLYVHIADVTHYVKEDSLVGEEAAKRATSIYFVDKVIPMIPEKLSNGLCSLNPNEDKLTMTCEMIVDKYGKIDFTRSKVYESVINSNAQTTYKEVQEIFEDKRGIGDEMQFSKNVDENLIETVKNSFELSRKLNELRKKEGELIFENSEIKISLDDERNPIAFKKYETYESNDLIKALMVAANETVSTLYGKGPFLHRTHQEPKKEKIELLKTTLAYLEIDIEGLDINAGNIDKLLKKVAGHEKEKALTTLILRTLQLAKYTNTLEGHHGLALTNYSHFTSPIRRYPDTQIHRIIKETLHGELDEKHYNELLEEVAMNCSLKEQRAENIERKINTLYHIKHLEPKIDQEFDGTIMMINERGTQIQLNDANIGGSLDLDKAGGYSYNKIDKGLAEILTPSQEIIKIGDKSKFRLVSLDKEKLTINFELV